MCVAAACVPGAPIAAFDSANVSVRWSKDGTVVLRHLGKGGPINVVGAAVVPADVYGLPDAPSWPMQLSNGQTLALSVRLTRWPQGEYSGMLTVKAAGCGDSHLQVPIASPYEYRVSDMPGCGGTGGALSLLASSLLIARRPHRERRPPLILG